MRQSFDLLGHHFDLPEVRHVGADRPTAWLAAGFDDMVANPIPALAYGLLFSIGGDIILVSSVQTPHLFMTAISGFFLIAPLLAAGLYELSRQRAAGGKPTFIDSVGGLRHSASSIALFGLVLAVIVLLWERISALAFAVVGEMGTGVGGLMAQIFVGGEHRAFVAVWFILGAMLALLTFAISAVSVPMMLDRNTGFVTAMMTSLRAFAVNLEAMVLWGLIIVGLTLLGFATLLVGLVFVMPMLGHATWHAYRDLVK